MRTEPRLQADSPSHSPLAGRSGFNKSKPDEPRVDFTARITPVIGSAGH
jgi:hypothetical protein